MWLGWRFGGDGGLWGGDRGLRGGNGRLWGGDGGGSMVMYSKEAMSHFLVGCDVW